jgi:hypothetical protein
MTCFEPETEKTRMDGECDNSGEDMTVYLPAKVIRGTLCPCSCPDVPTCRAGLGQMLLSGNVDMSSRVEA